MSAGQVLILHKRIDMTGDEIYQLRKDYTLNSMNKNEVAKDPLTQFRLWWEEAERSQILEHNAMILSTVTPEGMPEARTVLLKAFNDKGFVFFTNYNSAKSAQLDANGKCSLLFFWKELERQVRINGVAERISAAESIAYFDSRPKGSQIGAWASPQSMAVAGKSWLKETYQYYAERFSHGKIPKPPHWGGYRVTPQKIEFWQGRPSRMHDRILYSAENNEWKISRLAP